MAAIDRKTKFPFAMSAEHYRVHDEGMYRVDPIYTATADSATAEMLIVAGSTTECHLVVAGFGDGNMQGELLRNVTYSTTGSSIAAVNFNDDGTDSTTTKFYKTPTNATGTIWIKQYIPGGGVKNPVGSNARTNLELILENGNYLLRLHNLAGTASTLGISGEFYEIQEG